MKCGRSKSPKPIKGDAIAERAHSLFDAYARHEQLDVPRAGLRDKGMISAWHPKGGLKTERARITAAAGVAVVVLGSGVAVSAMVGYQPLPNGLPALLQLSPTPAPAASAEPKNRRKTQVGGTAPDSGSPVAPGTSGTATPGVTTPGRVQTVPKTRRPSTTRSPATTPPSTTKPPTTPPPTTDPPTTTPPNPGVTTPPPATDPPDPPTSSDPPVAPDPVSTG
ncbi:hypothetical protein [Actinomadura rudentiformis]|uniref:Uncharacterized protein n=1 Tax=Actinomadura rudentiformis TaxID=359158 RepID=A0A6H9Z1V2_9ACTN|nr:hypothetical protein [Actinomadura rudentiformis]KAB2348528.1 hypothetical protein F8566_17260 [Actinomadura rudentiformis]